LSAPCERSLDDTKAQSFPHFVGNSALLIRTRIDMLLHL
jgi:hypothetical protein